MGKNNGMEKKNDIDAANGITVCRSGPSRDDCAESDAAVRPTEGAVEQRYVVDSLATIVLKKLANLRFTSVDERAQPTAGYALTMDRKLLGRKGKTAAAAATAAAITAAAVVSSTAAATVIDSAGNDFGNYDSRVCTGVAQPYEGQHRGHDEGKGDNKDKARDGSKDAAKDDGKDEAKDDDKDVAKDDGKDKSKDDGKDESKGDGKHEFKGDGKDESKGDGNDDTKGDSNDEAKGDGKDVAKDYGIDMDDVKTVEDTGKEKLCQPFDPSSIDDVDTDVEEEVGCCVKWLYYIDRCFLCLLCNRF